MIRAYIYGSADVQALLNYAAKFQSTLHNDHKPPPGGFFTTIVSKHYP